MNDVTVEVEGIHCTGCASTIPILLQQRVAAIEKAGYRVTSRSATS